MSGVIEKSILLGKKKYLEINSVEMGLEIERVAGLVKDAYSVNFRIPIVRFCCIIYPSTIQAIEEAGLKAVFVQKDDPDKCGIFDIHCEALSLQELEEFASKQVGKK